MKCGVLYYLHIAKTGGAEVVDHLQKEAAQTKWSFYNYNYWTEKGDVGRTWQSILNMTRDLRQPKAIVYHHHGAPGLRDTFERELKPLSCALAAKGCRLVLATTVREPTTRMVATYNMDALNGHELPLHEYVSANSNVQAKYLLKSFKTG